MLCARKSGIPTLPPTSNPSDCEMMANAPPAPTRVFVAMEDTASPVQTVIRPRVARDPYETGIPGVYICSAATPPGAGAHGMNGYNAALSALRRLERA